MTTYPTNRDEIIELAQLEVLGALESADCARLERLFRDASPQLQREVIDVQAELANQSALLPAIEPEGSLRLRVLASVAQAIESSDAELAPIASIGRRARRERSAGASFATPFEPVDRLAPMRIAEDMQWRKSAVVWRAVAIASIGALVASLAFLVIGFQQSARISELALQNSVSAELYSRLGKDFPAFLEPGVVTKGLRGVTARDSGSMTVLLAPTLDAAFIAWIGVGSGQSLRLQSIDRQSGLVRDVGVFSVESPLSGTQITIPIGTANTSSDWQVVNEQGAVVFTSRTE